MNATTTGLRLETGWRFYQTSQSIGLSELMLACNPDAFGQHLEYPLGLVRHERGYSREDRELIPESFGLVEKCVLRGEVHARPARIDGRRNGVGVRLGRRGYGS